MNSIYVLFTMSSGPLFLFLLSAFWFLFSSFFEFIFKQKKIELFIWKYSFENNLHIRNHQYIWKIVTNIWLKFLQLIQWAIADSQLYIAKMLHWWRQEKWSIKNIVVYLGKMWIKVVTNMLLCSKALYQLSYSMFSTLLS